jgi:hypothetical protein
LSLFLFDLNAVILHLRQGNDLLNIQQDPVAVAVWLDPNAANDEVSVVQPHYCGR